jgi:DNA repair exonuclease SbcCD nuclease subunit
VTERAFRFLVAGDLQLEKPAYGLDEVNDSLRELMIEAPFLAAERVFETALAENVDFVMLTGNVVDPWTSGPRGVAFLVEQFQRLAARDISVYWVGSPHDDVERWPAGIELPANVIRLPIDAPQAKLIQRDDESLACILGVSTNGSPQLRQQEFATQGEIFTLAVIHGQVETSELANSNVDFWAIGGSHDRQVLSSVRPVMLCPGSPQGRCPSEIGTHGCTLVEVSLRGPIDSERRPTRHDVRMRFLPTDVLRWQSIQLRAEHLESAEQLQDALLTQLAALQDTSRDTDLVIHVSVICDAQQAARWRSVLPAVLERARTTFGYRSPACWTASIKFQTTARWGARYADEDTLLGDVLRELSRYAHDPSLPIELASYLHPRQLAGTLGSALAHLEGESRDDVLTDAAALIVDLLGPRGESDETAQAASARATTLEQRGTT